jgi:hypothetical protein
MINSRNSALRADCDLASVMPDSDSARLNAVVINEDTLLRSIHPPLESPPGIDAEWLVQSKRFTVPQMSVRRRARPKWTPVDSGPGRCWTKSTLVDPFFTIRNMEGKLFTCSRSSTPRPKNSVGGRAAGPATRFQCKEARSW